MDRPARPHYLRENHTVDLPPNWVYLDTETTWTETAAGELHTLRVWVAALVTHGKDGTPDGPHWADGDDVESLVAIVHRWLRGRRRLWICTHNLSFDLAATRLPQALTRHGWTYGDVALSGRSVWLRMKRDSATLTMVDSAGWLPMPLAELGTQLRMPKPKLPAQDAGRDAWVARCRADVQIMMTGMEQLQGWWRAENKGHWSITGPACGWNAMRHTPTRYKVLIDPDPAGVRADRQAVYGGRRDVWHVGTLSKGPFFELDFKAAYPTVAEYLPLPIKRNHWQPAFALNDQFIGARNWGVLAECELDTDRPNFPVRWQGEVWYPVGRFRTVLADPEIVEARRLGVLRAVGPGWVHKLGYAMQPWAQWCNAAVDDTTGETPPAARIACKLWGRSVIGRWAAHGYERIELGPAPTLDWGYQEGWEHAVGRPAAMMDLDGTRYWCATTEAGENTYPAVLAWVESHVRMRLGRVIDALGPGCIVQCDTDGLIVNGRTVGTRAARGAMLAPTGLSATGRLNWCLDQINLWAAPLTLRVKRRVSHVNVLGPQHLEIGGERSYSGLPQLARLQAGSTFTFRAWPKLSWQMQHNPAGGYLRPDVSYTAQGPYAHRWVLRDGRAVPCAAETAPDGTTRILPWLNTPGRPETTLGLAERQHRLLAGLFDRPS